MPVIVTADFPPAIGGIQTYIERIAECLTKRGHSVVVVAPAAPPSTSHLDETRSYRVIRYEKTGRIATLVAMDRAIGEAREHVADDVTIASSWFPAGIVTAIRRVRKGGTLAIMAFGSEIARQDTRPRRFLMRSVFARADAVISISRFTSKCLRDAGIDRTPVLAGCGVGPCDYRPSRGLIPTIVSVGRLVRRKGFDRVIASLPALRTCFPDLRYEIVGDGPDRAYLSELAESLGVSGNVIFHGACSEREMRDAYERAWCFALPVRPERHDVEGFGLVYLEAAMARVPSVGGRYSGAEDAIVHGVTGLLVDGRSSTEVTSALDVLLRDRDFSAMLGNAAYERAIRDLTWDRVACAIAGSVGLA